MKSKTKSKDVNHILTLRQLAKNHRTSIGQCLRALHHQIRGTYRTRIFTNFTFQIFLHSLLRPDADFQSYDGQCAETMND